MRRFSPIALFFALFLASCGLAAAGEAHPWDNKRIYYVIEYQGRLREKGFFVRRPGSYQKRPCVITEEEKHSYAEHDPNLLILSVRIKTITTPSGEALQRQEETFFGEPGREVINVSGGEADFASSGFFGRSIRVPMPRDAVFEVSGEWLAAQRPQVGKTVPIDIIDRIGRRHTREEVRFTERLSAGDAQTPAVWIATFNTPERPPLYARFTSDGRLLRLDSEGLTYQVVGRDDYARGAIPQGMEPPFDPASDPVPAPAEPNADVMLREPLQPGVYPEGGVPAGQPAIAIGDSVPAWDSFAWLRFQASPVSEWLSAVANSPYAQVENFGSYANITATRNAPRVDANAVFPLNVPPEVQPFLDTFPQIPSATPAIIERARQAVMDTKTRRTEANVVRAISYLAGWVNQNVAVTEWNGEVVPPLRALSGRSADSLGHARLFAALARSLGVPTRLCQGFLAQTGIATYHCWAEVWINGTWIPVDTTVSRVGLPAGYVLAEYSGPDGRFRKDFADFMRLPVLTLNLVSAGRETPARQPAELVVGDRRTYAVSEGDWMANLYWGFALRLPPDWVGSAKLNSVEIASPDRLASVKCEAMSGDYQAGKPELDSNIANLKASLDRFRLVDSRVVSFDTEGATPALFIDFTCRQDDQSLRCRQYFLPRRHRAFRISFWAPAERFTEYAAAFDNILATFEY